MLTTAAGAVTAHITASRFDEQISNYLATAQRLSALELQASDTGQDGPSWPDFVYECENVISSQNQAWMSVLTEDV